MATLNTRSLKPKEQLVLRELSYHNVDICLVLKSWLKDSHWLKSSDLNTGLYRCYTANRTYLTGGGIALICNSTFDVKFLDKANNQTYKHATWQISFKKSITLTGVYHPPPKNNITNAVFTNKLTDHLTKLLTTKHNNIVLGDFNMHIDDLHDADASIFLDTITALGIEQHINVPTHYKGNTLDLNVK